MRSVIFSMAGAALLAVAVPAVLAQKDVDKAKADIIDSTADIVGRVALTETTGGVQLHVTLTKIPAGTHAFHIHTTGKCETPFTTAGGHFNPAGKQHGKDNPMGPHAGDLANIVVPDSGQLTFDVTVAGVTLKSGPNSLMDADGSAIVIHEAADDYKTDPTGNAGARIACGVVSLDQAALDIDPSQGT